MISFFVGVARWRKPEMTIEGLRTLVRWDAAREQLHGAVGGDHFSDQPYGLATVPAPLVSFVDEQLSQAPRPDDSRRPGGDVPAQHHEADGLVVRVDRSIPGLRLRNLVGVSQRTRHCSDEPLLCGRNAEREDGLDVVPAYFAKSCFAHQNREP